MLNAVVGAGGHPSGNFHFAVRFARKKVRQTEKFIKEIKAVILVVRRPKSLNFRLFRIPSRPTRSLDLSRNIGDSAHAAKPPDTA
ncbi:MAG: hypothetical protein ACK4GC_04100 [Paracoccaceae bacterium]